MKKRLTAIGLMLAFFTTGALAATSYQKTITVDYGVTLSINGSTPTLTDVNGNTVQPFTYNGTTYVPIRAIADNMGALVDYDSGTKTATVTSFGGELDLWVAKICQDAAELVGYGAEATARMDMHTVQYSKPSQGELEYIKNVVSTFPQWSNQISGWVAQIRAGEPYYNEMNQLKHDLNQYTSDISEFYVVYYSFISHPTTADVTALTQLDVRLANDVSQIRDTINTVTAAIYSVFD